MEVEEPRWSALIIRAWIDDRERGGLRARLTELEDLDRPGRPVAVAGTVDEVIVATRAWLARIVAQGRHAGEG